jgi:hypothetical protein
MALVGVSMFATKHDDWKGVLLGKNMNNEIERERGIS